MHANWTYKFDYDVTTPEGRRLLTLRDAGDYINALPDHIANTERWQLAAKEVLRATTDVGWVGFARSGMIAALWPEWDKERRITHMTRRQKTEQFRQRRAEFIRQKKAARK